VNGKGVKQYATYSDWKRYVLVEYKRFYSNSREWENFRNFLKRKNRDAIMDREGIIGVAVPIDVALFAVYLGIIGDKIIGGLFIAFFVLFLAWFVLKGQGAIKDAKSFTEDLLEILGNKEKENRKVM